MMMKHIKSILLLVLICASYVALAQTQMGADIDGTAAGEKAGWSVSMPDRNTVAIGAHLSDGNGIDAGQARVFKWNGTTWMQKGNDINGEEVVDKSGWSVSMPDSNTVAIGAPFNDGNGIDAGHVRIYEWNGTTWLQKGNDIDGEAVSDRSGYSVSMPNVNTVAIGASYNDGSGFDAGQVRVFEWNETAWIQKGMDIDGETAGDLSGNSVSMPDEHTVAIGAHSNNGNGQNAGQVRIYAWSGDEWVQKGSDIDGEAANDWSGYSVSMPDANTVSIGAYLNDGNGSDAGHVRIYQWNGVAWLQKGNDIDGERDVDWSGYSVSMPDENTVAIGAIYNDGNGSNAGHLRIYEWNGTVWMQRGSDIDGEENSDNFGYSVSMPEPDLVSAGAIQNDGNGTDAGQVRVYSFATTGIIERDFRHQLTVFPNPTQGNITIAFENEVNNIQLYVRNVFGQEVFSKNYNASTKIDFPLSCSAGIYFVEITTADKKAVLKVIKE